MTQHITIGGRERPVCFDNILAYEYQRTTGKSYLRDLNALFSEFRDVAAKTGEQDTLAVASQISIDKLVDLFHCAIRLGCRLEKVEIDFDEYSVAKWLMDEPAAITELMGLLAAANGDPDAVPSENGDAGKKKKITPQKSIGSPSSKSLRR